MYDTFKSHEDFATSLSAKPPETICTPSQYDSDIDDCYPFDHEMAPPVTGTAANSFVSNAITDVDHNGYAETADDVSGTQFTAQETEAQKRLVETVLSALAPSLQNCIEDCVAASIQAPQAVIAAQKSPVQSSVSAHDDNNSAASYFSPPPSLDDYNPTSVYDSDDEPTQFATPAYTSVVCPPVSQLPASQLSSSQLRIARMARGRAKNQLRHEKKTRAWRAMAQRPMDYRDTTDTDTETGHTTRIAAQRLAWDTRETAREAERLEVLTRYATRKLIRQEHEKAWRAENDTLSEAPLHLVTNRVTKNGKVLEDTAWFL